MFGGIIFLYLINPKRLPGIGRRPDITTDKMQKNITTKIMRQVQTSLCTIKKIRCYSIYFKIINTNIIIQYVKCFCLHTQSVDFSHVTYSHTFQTFLSSNALMNKHESIFSAILIG